MVTSVWLTLHMRPEPGLRLFPSACTATGALPALMVTDRPPDANGARIVLMRGNGVIRGQMNVVFIRMDGKDCAYFLDALSKAPASRRPEPTGKTRGVGNIVTAK
jgi:hypothetical protein